MKKKKSNKRERNKPEIEILRQQGLSFIIMHSIIIIIENMGI